MYVPVVVYMYAHVEQFYFQKILYLGLLKSIHPRGGRGVIVSPKWMNGHVSKM
jgi:hypothetical protein